MHLLHQHAAFSPPVIPFMPRPHPLLRTQSAKRARLRQTTMCQTPPSQNSDDPPITPRDWREFRAALVAGSKEELQRSKQNAYRTGHWAHALSVPETGCFLASHPAYYRRAAPYLTQSVVFLTAYDASQGSTGLVLNRPLRGTAAQLEAAGLFGRSTKLSETPLHAHPVYTGGPDTGEHVLTALHGDVRLAQPSSSRQPLDGVFLDDAMHLVGRDNVDMAQVRIFSGCIRWRKGELEREVDEGSWYCISASNLFALKHCIQLPKPLWVEIMQSQGQPFAQIASRVYNEDSEEDATE